MLLADAVTSYSLKLIHKKRSIYSTHECNFFSFYDIRRLTLELGVVHRRSDEWQWSADVFPPYMIFLVTALRWYIPCMKQIKDTWGKMLGWYIPCMNKIKDTWGIFFSLFDLPLFLQASDKSHWLFLSHNVIIFLLRLTETPTGTTISTFTCSSYIQLSIGGIRSGDWSIHSNKNSLVYLRNLWQWGLDKYGHCHLERYSFHRKREPIDGSQGLSKFQRSAKSTSVCLILLICLDQLNQPQVIPLPQEACKYNLMEFLSHRESTIDLKSCKSGFIRLHHYFLPLLSNIVICTQL